MGGSTSPCVRTTRSLAVFARIRYCACILACIPPLLLPLFMTSAPVPANPLLTYSFAC